MRVSREKNPVFLTVICTSSLAAGELYDQAGEGIAVAGVYCNSRGQQEQTTPPRAAGNEQEHVAKLFSEREDVNPDTTDTNYGRTSLSLPAENGHKDLVRMLLKREVSVPTHRRKGAFISCLESRGAYRNCSVTPRA